MIITRKFLFAASIATGLVFSAAAQAASWQPYVSRQDGFSVQVAGPVFVRNVPVTGDATQRINKITTYTQTTLTSVFMVVATENKKKVDFDSLVRSVSNLSTCATVSNDTPKHKKAAQFREVSGKSCMNGKYDIGNVFYAKGNRFYQATYVVGAGADKKSAEYFLHSFAMQKVKASKEMDRVAMN